MVCSIKPVAAERHDDVGLLGRRVAIAGGKHAASASASSVSLATKAMLRKRGMAKLLKAWCGWRKRAL